jgi:membrane protein DedA with SNARE-associated domain
MSAELITSISQYGYFAILCFVLLQEAGVPTPIPNELVLIFSGYLAFTGVFNPFLVLAAAIIGDLLASFFIFETFYYSGKFLLKKKPKWLPIPKRKLIRLSGRIKRSNNLGPFIGRLTPFVRGWVSVLSGLLQLPQKKYSMVLLTTSVIWASAYVSIGFLLGPYWEFVKSLIDTKL